MNILAINPWIYDFAAYDFWLKPYGFLVILTYLKNKGFDIDYIDCLDSKNKLGDYGRGKYTSENIEKPPVLKSIPRYFKRYGIKTEEFINMLENKNPSYILVTSSMTYWYPAIIDVITLLKKHFTSPVILGGTYATLCFEHAKKNIPCEFIFRTDNLKDFFSMLNIDVNYDELYSTLPSYEYFYRKLDYIILRTSWGCPYQCSFCAIKRLSNNSLRIQQEKIIDYLAKYNVLGIKDFVLYDDAFLYEQASAKNLLINIKKLNFNLRFHTPNALHLRFLDEEIAYLLKETGFINPHFGLETLNSLLQKQWGDKVNRADLIKGVNLLKKAGFNNGEFSVYLLLGFPHQDLNELQEDVEFLHSIGAKISLSEFSPVPHTEIFENYKDTFSEPLLHNNSIFGFFHDKLKEFWKIKNYVRELNKKF